MSSQKLPARALLSIVVAVGCSSPPIDADDVDVAPLVAASGWSSSAPGYHGSEPLLERVAYLTFDDGPTEWTDGFLDVLHDEGIRGTFYINGMNAKQHGLSPYASIVRRTLDDGHALGNHGMHHGDLTKLAPDGVAEELDGNQRELTRVLAPTLPAGAAPVVLDLLRAPFGRENDVVRAAFAARGFDATWNVVSTDSDEWSIGEYFCDYEGASRRLGPGFAAGGLAGASERTLMDDDCVAFRDGAAARHLYDPTASEYLAKVARLEQTVLGSKHVAETKGIVVLMHDSHPTSRDALRVIIQGLRRSGYVFETVDQLRRRVMRP